MSFNFDDPIIVMNRTAPYPLKTDIFTIINGKIQLAEKPDSFLRFPEVKNTVDNSLYYEIKSGIPENNQFICDYTNSLLTFNSSQNGKTISAQYHSMGVAFIPVSKIYTVENNGSVTETLDQTLTNNINTLNNSTEDAIDTINTTKDNAVNTIITTKNDTISTVNVTSEDTIDEINNLLGTATNIINDGISQINYDKNTSKYYIDSITGNAIQEINNVTTETLSTIDSKINDLVDDAQNAVNNAQTALGTANTAISNTNNAINNANTATTNANIQANTANTSATNANIAIQNINNAINNLNMIFQNPVSSFNDIATAYSNAQAGWVVQTLDDNKFYRYNGTIWVYFQQINSTILTDLQNKIGNLSSLLTTDQSNIINAINELYNKLSSNSWDISYDNGILINHNLNSYPVAQIIADTVFGHGGFNQYAIGSKFQLLNRMEYIDNNNVRVFLEEPYNGTPIVNKIDNDNYNIVFSGEESSLQLIFK